MSEQSNWSKPNYDSWKDGIQNLPDRRFFFVATQLALVLVAYLVSDSLAALTVVLSLMVAFGIIGFFAQRRSGDDQEKPKDRQAKPSD